MGWEHVLAFNLTLLAALASPGPALLMALRMSLQAGPRAGIATGLGLAAMAATWTGAALIGLDAVFVVVPRAYMALKLAGAAYLLYLAFGIWRSARAPLAGSKTVRHGHALRTGLLVNLANPKSVLFASAVLLLIFPPGLGAVDKTLIVVNHLAVGVLAYSGFAVLLSTRPARDGYLRLKPLMDRIAALVLGALGLRLILDR